jgi:hypothetical protein
VYHLLPCLCCCINIQKNFWVWLQRYVKRVLRSVKNISIWNIVGYVRNPVVNVQKSVVRWLGKVKKERVLYTFQFFYLLYFLPIPLASNMRSSMLNILFNLIPYKYVKKE